MVTLHEYVLDAIVVLSFMPFDLLRAELPRCDLITGDSCAAQGPVTSPPMKTQGGRAEHSELVHYVHRSCFCDELCKILNDCCADYTESGATIPHNSHGALLEMYKEYLSLSPLSNLFGYYTSGIAIREAILGSCWIEKCPKYFPTSRVRTLCEDDGNIYGDKFLWWPVSNMKTGVTYRNLYCSICWQDTKTVFWEISVGCTYVNSEYGDYFSSFMTDPLMAEDYENIRSKRSENTTDMTDTEVAQKGYEVTPPTGVSGTINRDILTKLERCSKYLLNPFGMRNLRNFKLKIISKCPDNYSDETVKELCGNYTYIIYDNSTECQLYKNTHCAVCNGVKPENIECNWKDRITASLDYGSDTQPFYPITVLFEPQGGKIVVIDGGVSSSSNINVCAKNEIYDLFHQKCREVYCPWMHLFVNGSCVRIQTPSVLAFMPMSPKVPELDCPQVTLGRNEFKVLENGKVALKSSEVVLNSTNFRFVNESILVCTEFVASGNASLAASVTWKYEFEHAAMILSASGQIFSIVCLALNFIIYAMLPSLRNTPGKTLMSLVLALFLSQLTFLVGAGRTKNHVTCVLAATIIHYFILASFVWMNVLSLDLALAFSPTNLHGAHERAKQRRFIAFSLYAWISPLVVVGISLLLDLHGDASGEFTPNYGQHICWISNPKAVGLLFILPLGLLLAVNVILYVFTAVNIYKATVAAEMVRKRNKRSLRLYVKLSIIMGGTWIFAFIWIITKGSVAQYLFIILNSLQGAFIFFSFVFRRKVWRLLRKLYGNGHQKTSSSTGTGKGVTYCASTEMNNHDKVCTVNTIQLVNANPSTAV